MLKQKPVIACDIDGVLCDTMGGINFLREAAGLPTLPTTSKFDMTDLPDEGRFYALNQFKKPDVYSVSQPYKVAACTMHELTMDHAILYITSRTSTFSIKSPSKVARAIEEVTVAWLKQHGFPDAGIYFVRKGEHKHTEARRIAGRHLAFAIEDNYWNARGYADNGVLTFMPRRKYNVAELANGPQPDLLKPIFDLMDIRCALESGRCNHQAEYDMFPGLKKSPYYVPGDNWN